MMKRIKKRTVLKTKITAYISFEAYDKLEQLSEELGISRSQLIEKCFLAVYNALKEKEKDSQQTSPKEGYTKRDKTNFISI
jgi:hypothetical protein